MSSIGIPPARPVLVEQHNPLSNQELLRLDAADGRTKRGGKLERDKNSIKSLAKVWIIFFILGCVFFASLRVSGNTNNPECSATGLK